jgi:thiamine biosynthesis lipoprotein
MPLRLSVLAMGTRFELVLDGDGPERELRAAGEAALEHVSRCDARYSQFRADSLVSRVNREAGRAPVRLDGEAYELIERCLELRAATAGAFDVTVGPYMRAWGFHPRRDEVERAGPGAYELDLATRSIRFTAEGTSLDLGAIGKGHALDLAAAELRACGVERALLHGGTSSVVALGSPPGERGWRVRIGARGAAVAVLRDAALSVSAPSGRTVEIAGHTFGHVLDPRDGRPVPQGELAAVAGPTATLVEAWSTALLVLRARGEALPAAPANLSTLLERDGDLELAGDAFELALPVSAWPSPA